MRRLVNVWKKTKLRLAHLSRLVYLKGKINITRQLYIQSSTFHDGKLLSLIESGNPRVKTYLLYTHKKELAIT